MGFLVYAILFVIAAALVIGLIVGVAFELIGYLFAALIVVAAVTFIMNKIRGPRHRDALKGRDPPGRLR